MNPRTPFAAFAVAAVLSSSACAPAASTECSPDNCGGCCDSNGVCQPGDAVAVCGGAGLACDVCVGSQVCSAGRCGDGTGAGGGSGGGGGGAGMCTPTTCAALGKNCGAVADGCGGMLACGTCSGAMCAMTCPAGFSCNAAGACAGGSASSLALDVKTVRVAGNVTINGAAPVNLGTACASYPTDSKATLTFLEQAKGYRVTVQIPCSSAATAFAADLFPGTYAVNVEGTGSANTNLPRASYQAAAAFVVGAPLAGQIFDVKTVVVSGTVTLNGATPAHVGTACSSSPGLDKARVVFQDKAKSTFISVGIPCSSASFAYSIVVFPGTYEVRVEGTSFSNLPSTQYPSEAFLAQSQLAVSAPIAGKVLDVSTVLVSGQLTLNGATPVNAGYYCSSYPAREKARVDFIEKAKGYRLSAIVPCSSTAFAFSAALFAGTYDVRVTGSDESNLPQTSYQAAGNLVVAGPLSNQVFDIRTSAVTGNITLNGATPADVGTRCQGSPSDVKATVTFSDKAKDYEVTAKVLCSSPTFAFNGTLFPGTYEVRVQGTTASNLPVASFLAGQLQVGGAIPGQIFDVKTVPFSGTLTLNGAAPSDVGSDCLTSPNDAKATVTFTDASKGHVITARVLCASATFAYGTALFPGTYDVRVDGTTRADLPVGGYQAHAALVVSSGKSAQVLDVKTVSAGGKLTINGAVPANTGMHCFMYPNDVKANVTFFDAAKGYLLTAKVRCGSADFAFGTALFPGTYEVRVEGTARSSVPVGSYLAVTQLAVQ